MLAHKCSLGLPTWQPYSTPEAQSKVQLTHDADIGRLAYSVRLGSDNNAETDAVAIRRLLRRTRRSLFWRLANQTLFAAIAQMLHIHVQEAWPGALNISNVKDGEDGEGGKFDLWIPEAALEVEAAPAAAKATDAQSQTPGSSAALDAPAEPVYGGLLTGACTFRVVTQEESGGQLELARIASVVVLDLDRMQFAQHVISCQVNQGLLDLSLADRMHSAARAVGLQQQHLACADKSGYLNSRGQLLPIWRRRWFVLHHGTLRYWVGLPPFYPMEWSPEELREHTSIDVIQLAGATLTLRIGGRPDAPVSAGRRQVDEAIDTGGSSMPSSPTAAVPFADPAEIMHSVTSTWQVSYRPDEPPRGQPAPERAEAQVMRARSGSWSSSRADAEPRVELELTTPHARYPRYVLRADSPEETRAWASAIERHMWPV